MYALMLQKRGRDQWRFVFVSVELLEFLPFDFASSNFVFLFYYYSL